MAGKRVIRDKFHFRGILFFSLFLLLATFIFSQSPGTGRGKLVIVGGAMKNPQIIARFIQLAGGPDAPVVVIPTAGGGKQYDQYWGGLRLFREAGLTRISMLHTTSRIEADSIEFVKPLQEARGVFISGGRQWRLADAYLNTRTQRELEALLARGGVIGGSSAGATIMGSFLVRGDTKGNALMMGDHLEGFSFLKKTAIDQHLLMRNRHFDMIEVIKKHPDLLGIGLDEDTAIVVQGNSFEVIGSSYVAIYDSGKKIPPSGHFYFLAPGDRFNLKTRQGTRPASTTRPIGRVKQGRWAKKD